MAEKFADSIRAVLFAGIFGAILVIIYLVVVDHDMSWNLSSSQKYGLSPQTKRIIHSMGFDIHIRVFEAQDQEQNKVRNLLALYSQESRTITYEIIDPDARPGLARHYDINRYGQAVFTGAGKETLIDTVTEEEIANAMLMLKHCRRKNIYVLSGHGESEISDKGRQGLSRLAEALKRDGCTVKRLLLTHQQTVPQDADLLVIPSPEIPLVTEELASLQGYIDRGGKVLIALEPRSDGGLKDLLGLLGIGLGNDIVKDPSSKALGGDDTLLVVNSYGGIKEFSGFDCVTLFPTSRTLKADDNPPPYITISSLARTSDKSRAENDPAFIMPQGKEAGGSSDLRGPFDVALFARVAISEDTEARIMVFGDGDFMTNTYLNVSGNNALAMNCINALLDGGPLLRIDPGQARDKPFILTPGQTVVLFLVSVVFIPSLVLSPILAIRWKRRQT